MFILIIFSWNCFKKAPGYCLGLNNLIYLNVNVFKHCRDTRYHKATFTVSQFPPDAHQKKKKVSF